MTQDIVARLRELLSKATPGPWKCSPYRGSIDSQVWAGEPGDDAVLICADGDAPDADAALIVEAINALPELLAEIERLSCPAEDAVDGWSHDDLDRFWYKIGKALNEWEKSTEADSANAVELAFAAGAEAARAALATSLPQASRDSVLEEAAQDVEERARDD